jgi:sugar O-acyltransferase (sialic acid O-acetyltransferase NeuD family)
MDKPVMIIGASGLGKAVLDIFTQNDVVVYGFLDDKKERHGETIGGISVLGSPDEATYFDLLGQKCDVFVASDDTKLKKGLIQKLRRERKVMPVNAIHPNAGIASTAIIHHGNLIAAQVNIGANAEVGNHCLLHSACTIEYGASIGDFSQIGAGTIIGAEAKIGKEVFIGSGAVVVGNVEIEDGASIGAGSVVIGKVEKGKTVFGNPATEIKR